MDAVKFYKMLYKFVGAASPLTFDCGRLCGKACCQVTPDLPGMYLLPGEEALYHGKDGFTMSNAILPGFGNVNLLSCDGHCDRDARPLECRIFPLSPKIVNGELSLRMDPRGRPVCPLCHEGLAALSTGFVGVVNGVFAALMAEPDTAAFLNALSEALDEYERPFL
jgi:hypothetical protein